MFDLSQFSRRRFLTTAAASRVSAVLLKAYGNPPEPSGTAATEKVEVADINPEMMPETTKVVLSYIPIVEAAPLVIAKERAFFAKYGMTNVEISKQANWASARDNVTIGSQGKGIDGGKWQMPMPHLISCTWKFECQFLD
ncbi:hypothetical protein BC008_41800 [Mastigocoleus testarum BC008]|uniref:Uncharacterized protein n=1 Tax=Mastigocoleus testarum BC008 TaxID=371196 RepID=A0A0V7ZLV8_9CYAN|nr:hypothetical protein BC008_41800 [Mastigocoleus testarum BC008]